MKPVRNQIGDQVKQRIQRGLSVRKESKHGLSGWHRVGPAEKYLVLAGLVFWFSEHKEAQQINADISVRWEPDGIFAYHTD
jgi:hypothetical protein